MKLLDLRTYNATEDYIGLLSYEIYPADKPFCNLFRCTKDGEAVWIAELPPVNYEGDCYVDYDIKGWGEIFAHTYSGYRVVLDGLTGKIQTIEFTR